MSDLQALILRKLQERQLSKDTAFELLRAARAGDAAGARSGDGGAAAVPEVAVVGLACRFPKAPHAAAYWRNLADGVDCVGPFPESRRRDVDPYLGLIDPRLILSEDPYYVGGYLEEIDRFDSQYFNVLPGEAKYIEPEQRVFLETALEACEDAGYGGERLYGSSTGVFVGNSGNQYGFLLRDNVPSAAAGNIPAFIAGRFSYVFDLSGPSMMVSVGCSSSLLAVHLACQALAAGDCEMAVAGGITLDLFPVNRENDIWNLLGIARTGVRCRAFADDAAGIAKGEGSGAVVLKPLAAARRDRDHVYAVIRGSATNHDGHSNGITAPNALAQAEMLKRAWRRAGIDPRTLSYVEAHGTGTRIGDPIEIKGLSLAFREFTRDRRFCAIGSAKTNIGHLADGAAGVAGLIKTVLALRHRQLPPSLHFDRPNALIDFDRSPVFVNDRLRDWRPENGSPRRAGVSSFGLVGTNVHVVLEEAPAPELPAAGGGEEVLVLSGLTRTSLEGQVEAFRQAFAQDSPVPVEHLCFTANTGRRHLPHRVALLASDREGFRAAFEALTRGGTLCSVPEHGAFFSGDSAAPPAAAPASPRHVARHFTAGGEVDWRAFYGQRPLHKVPLPTYRFDRQRFWLEADEAELASLPAHTLGSPARAAGGAPAPAGAAGPAPGRGSVAARPERPTTAAGAEPVTAEGVRAVFSEVLGVREVPEDADFFDLGGDSLIAVQCLTALHKRFNRFVSYEDFFSRPTLSGLLELLVEGEEGGYEEIPAQPPLPHYPVSFSQRRLWVLEKLQEERVAYNLPAAYLFTGDFDPDALARGISGVIERHESFRTSFLEVDGEPRQVIHAKVPEVLERHDLRHHPDAEERAREAMDGLAARPFDLGEAPLLRAALYRLADDRYLFAYVIHHIVFDGWSNSVLFQEILARYHAARGGRAPELPELPIQYKDYAAWQNRSLLSEDRLAEHRAYWHQTFAGPVPVTEIRGDKPRPAVFTFHGDIHRFRVPAPAVDLLTALARKQGGTLFMALLAVVFTLVHRYGAGTDLVLGSPIAGRPHHDLKRLIGFFVNTLALRVRVEPERDFLHLLSAVRTTALEAYEHQDFPFDLLVSELELAKDTSRSPLFNVNVALQNAELRGEEAPALEGTRVEPVFARHRSSKWDLAFDFIQDEDGLQAYVEYYSDHFTPGAIQDLERSFQTLLGAIVESPETPLAALDLLGAERRRTILRELSRGPVTELPAPTVDGWFVRQAARTPDATAVEGSERWSYGELERRSAAVARLLRDREHVSAGDRIGLLLGNRPETVAAVLGVLRAGAAYVPLDPAQPFERLKRIARDAGLRAVIGLREEVRTAQRLLWECPGLDAFLCLDSDGVLDEEEAQHNELMDRQLWDYVATEAGDEIAGGGWVSSYTGEEMSAEEMAEYRANVVDKLTPLLDRESRVLEIGCASGITLFGLAPHAGCYVATDLSPVMAASTRRRVEAAGLDHVRVLPLPADRIESLDEGDFDLVVINSVIHCFHGYNYLRRVLRAAVDRMAPRGRIFVGDVMDQDSKEELVASLVRFRDEHRGEGHRTKTEWDTELFVSRDFFRDLALDLPEIRDLTFSGKRHTLANELTRFRYDVLLEVDKEAAAGGGDAGAPTRCKRHYDRSDLAASPAGAPTPAAGAGNLAYVLYTSGSTGQPKGVMVEHRSLVNYVDWALGRYGGEDRAASFPFYSPLTFDLTVTSLFCPLLGGGKVVVHEGGFERTMDGLAADAETPVVKLTPAHLLYMIHGCRHDLRFDRYVVGGEALEPQLLRELARKQRRPFTVFNEYGPTEATVGCTAEPIDREAAEAAVAVSIGRPIANASVYVLDRRLEPVPPGARGELYLAGTGVARGYLSDPARTAERFVPDPHAGDGRRMYRSGDLGRFLPAGNLEFLGRADEQIKIRGYRVEPGEIEVQLTALPDVQEAVVTVWEEDDGSKALAAYVVSESELAPEDLRAHLGRTLPDYMVPSTFVRLEALPLTPNGKVDRKRLPRPRPAEGSGDSHPPRTELERRMVEAWQQVLRRDNLGIEDDFFELGGDSIKAIQVVSRLYEQQIKVEVRDVFQCPTVAQLVERAQVTESTAEQGPVTGEVPLTAIQVELVARRRVEPHHFNQAILLRATHELDVEALRSALRALQEHHDMLRARLRTEAGRPHQEIVPPDDLGIPLEVIDLGAVADPDAALAERADWLQASLDLERGPIHRLAVLRTASETHLLWVIHHLAVDGVSWRILLADLASAYAAARSRQALRLPPKSHSFKAWAEGIHVWSASRELLATKPYWRTVESAAHGRLALDDDTGPNRAGDAESASTRLGPEPTRRLLTDVHRAYNTGMDDVLLTALALALREHHGQSASLVALESHGREELFDDLDVSRTVGWFTAVYPVVLEVPDAGDPGRCLKEVKETLRSVPHGGVGHGVLRHLTPVHHTRDLEEPARAEVMFNYLGQLDLDVPSDLFEPAPRAAGALQSPRADRQHELEVTAYVQEGVLHLVLTFAPGRFSRAAAEALLTAFERRLLELVEHCLGREGSEVTPSDLTYKELSVEELDELFVE